MLMIIGWFTNNLKSDCMEFLGELNIFARVNINYKSVENWKKINL